MSDNLFEQYINESTEPLPDDTADQIRQLGDALGVASKEAMKAARITAVISHLASLYSLGAITPDEMKMILGRVKG